MKPIFRNKIAVAAAFTSLALISCSGKGEAQGGRDSRETASASADDAADSEPQGPFSVKCYSGGTLILDEPRAQDYDFSGDTQVVTKSTGKNVELSASAICKAEPPSL
jgi:hypothetical protein